MDELSGRLVASVGIDPAAAEKAVGIVPDFFAATGRRDKLQSLLAKLPVADAPSYEDACVMGAGARMVGAGHGMAEARGVVQKFTVYVGEKVGDDEVGEVGAATPGLVQFV